MPAIDGALVTRLRTALARDELVLHFQPEVDLDSGSVVAMEALLRWAHPERGLLGPADFLPAARSGGLLRELDEWVLSEAVSELARWQRLPNLTPEQRPQLWMNLSAAALVRPDITDRLERLILGAHLPAGALGLEVTEEALGAAGRDAVPLLGRLRELGVALAVDDFGTWYSSLATLGELPVDGVKLHRTFVRAVGTDLDEDNIVASVIRLAHAHDLYVVAEGVESWSLAGRLCELGCDRAHGYLFSGPVRSPAARRMLSRQVRFIRRAASARAAGGLA